MRHETQLFVQLGDGVSRWKGISSWLDVVFRGSENVRGWALKLGESGDSYVIMVVVNV